MRRHLWVFVALAVTPPALAGPFHAGGNVHDGEAVTCDLPAAEHLRNSAGRDGLGLCVFTSLDHAARWANEPALVGFRDFMEKHPGGGWPEKVDQFIPRMAASKGLPAPPYVQHTGGDAEFLRRALRTGRYVCVTYNGRDGVYYRGTIAHMVNLVHLSEKWAVIHDNNYPGRWLWMSPADFLARWRGSGGGWAVALLKAGPPPVPVNLRNQEAGVRGQEDGDGEAVEGRNYGLDPARVPGEACYRLNGKVVSRSEALAAFGDLPDDGARLRLTVVGDEELRQRVLADLASHPGLKALGGRLHVQAYAPEHWAVAGVGFAPGITLQPPAGPDGKAPVLFRMRAYAGPDALVSAIRKADPDYKPERDPDPAAPKSDPSSSIDVTQLSPAHWALGALALALVFVPRKERKR